MLQYLKIFKKSWHWSNAFSRFVENNQLHRTQNNGMSEIHLYLFVQKFICSVRGNPDL